MPVNFLDVKNQARELGLKAAQRSGEIKDRLEKGRELLRQCGQDPAPLKKRLDEALAASSGLRCALPASEALDAHFATPQWTPDWVILAADGSQINPDHHEAVEFGAINLGVIRMCPGCGEAPREFTATRLLFDEDLQTAGGLITEDMVALMRDLEERKLLVERAQLETRKVLTLTDGMLEIYGEPREGSESEPYKKKFDDYLYALRQLYGLGASVAGYVDQPRADFLVRLLELLLLENPREAGRARPLMWLTDARLLEDQLAPGERSAIYGIHSRSSEKFKDELELHFFYLNVGRPGDPRLARVEIPRWVAQNELLTNQVHAALVDQSRQMGASPYPYLLHRSHEIAVVKLEEKEHVLDMIAAELLKNGIEPGRRSGKLSAKLLQGRTSYSR